MGGLHNSTEPYSPPHRQSPLSVTDVKLEGAGGFQSPGATQQLSHQMTTGDSERVSSICILFAFHLHRTRSLPSPCLCSSSCGGRRWGVLQVLSFGEEKEGRRRRAGPLPRAAVGRTGSPEGQRSRETCPWAQDFLLFLGVIFPLKPRACCANEVALVA